MNPSTHSTTARPGGGPGDTHTHLEVDNRGALARLVMVLAAVVLAAVVTGVSETVLIVAALIVIILVHELGHFATAKWAGMKVTEYFVGFGPRLWSVRKGETEYGVKALPLGGYCKIVGMSNLEQVDPADEPRTYRQQPYWRRLSVGVAGSFMHYVMAFVLLWCILVLFGFPSSTRLEVDRLYDLATGPSPAEHAGLRLGDEVVGVDGRTLADPSRDLTPFIKDHAGRSFTIEVRRQGQRVSLPVTPIDLSTVDVKGLPADERPTKPTGFIGVGLRPPFERVGTLAALGKSVSGIGRFSWESLQALGGLFSPHGVTSYAGQLSGRGVARVDPGQPRFLSPVGFVRAAHEAAASGMRDVLVLLFSINVFVGLFNMVPLLPLDGGHVAIATYERLRSRRDRRYHADVAKMLPITYAVFFLLLFIGATSLYMDIVRPLANPFR